MSYDDELNNHPHVDGYATKIVKYVFTVAVPFEVELEIPWDAEPEDYEDQAFEELDYSGYELNGDEELIDSKYEEGGYL